MKHLIFILLPIYTLAQIESSTVYINGDKITNETEKTTEFIIERTFTNDKLTFERKIGKTYKDDNYLITPIYNNDKLIEYKEKDGYEVGVWGEVKREFGKFFKVHVSVLNKNDEAIDFMGDKFGTISSIGRDNKGVKNILPVNFNQYNEYVEKGIFGQKLFVSFVSSLYSTAMAYTSISGSIRYKSSFGSGYYSYSSTFYSPTLAQMEYNRMMDGFNSYLDYDNSVKLTSGKYLRNHTIKGKTAYEGFFVMPYDKKIEEIDIRIRVGETPFKYTLKFKEE